MAGPNVPISGGVVSWANNTQIIATGVTPFALSLSQDGAEHIARAFAGSGGATAKKGQRSLTGTISGQLGAPAPGDTAGAVAWAGGYTSNLDHWTMVLNAPAILAPGAFASFYRFAYPPIEYDAQGTFGGWYDNATNAVMVGRPDADATGTFTYQERGAVDNTLAGTIFTTRLGITANVDNLVQVEYAYRVDGDVTQSTPSTGAGIFAAGVVAAPTVGTLIFDTVDTAVGTQRFSVDAFWTRIAIDCRVGAMITVAIDWAANTDVTLVA